LSPFSLQPEGYGQRGMRALGERDGERFMAEDKCTEFTAQPGTPATAHQPHRWPEKRPVWSKKKYQGSICISPESIAYWLQGSVMISK